MKKKILIFDDDKDILQLSATIFSKEGYIVETHEDCANLLHIVDGYQPDLIIFDHQMPGMSGAEAITLLKKNDGYKNIPVVYYSSVNEIAETAAKIHADAWLQKPADTESLLNVVNRLLNIP